MAARSASVRRSAASAAAWGSTMRRSSNKAFTIVRLALENPGQHVRIEQVPVLGQTDPGAHLRTRLHQALGGENAHRLAVGRARHLEPIAGVDFAVENVARPQAAGNDAYAQVARDGSMQTQ
jgi:hypothetical protein